MEFKDKVTLIVGASSGIGRVVALKLAAAGAIVVVTARRKDKLDALAEEIINKGGRCLALAADALDEKAAEKVVKTTVEKFGRIDLVLLNAGGAPAIDMRIMTAAEVKYYMQTNYDVIVNYLFPVLEQMKLQRGGLVAHTNSLAGFLGIPMQGPYSAAKGAARLLIDTCRLEFAEYGIKFASLYPGFVATEVTKNDGMPAPLEISEEKCADYMLSALRKEKSDYLFPANMRFVTRLALLLPKSWVNKLLQGDVKPLPDSQKQ
jgi:NADP-dependent 3-hydroxy acid dehydrogenase YdfG